MFPLVEDMSKIYAHPLPRVYAIFLVAIEYSAKAQPPQHTTAGARAEYSMANRKIAYPLGRGWAYIFDIFPESIFPKKILTRHGMEYS